MTDLARIDSLHNAFVAEARKNGRLDAAYEIMEWVIANQDVMPKELRDDLGRLLLKVASK